MEAFIEILKFLSSLAWPATVIAIVFIFRGEIAAAIPRITKFGLAGAELQQQLSRAASAYAQTGKLRQFPHLPRTASIERLELESHQALELIKPEEHLDILVREVAVWRLVAACEAIWGSIYRSQLHAVLFLTEQGDAGASSFALRMFHSAPKYPETYSFETWLGYLVRGGIVAVDADERVTLTPFGKDFADWCTNKPVESRPP